MEREPGFTAVPKNLQFRVGLLLGLTIVIAVGFTLYALYARGVFEATQRLTLVADNAEGVSIGMDLTFAGFPIGRVQRIALADDGRARIEIDVPRKDARWLRESSIFTLERGLVGGARLRAYTGELSGPELPDGALRQVLRGDTAEEIPRMVATLRSVLENVEQITASGGSLQASLDNVRTATDRANALLASMGSVSRRLDSVLGKTEERLFSAGGVLDASQDVIVEAGAVLGEIRDTLKRADGILADAQQVGANTKAATADLGVLRAEVEASLHKLTGLIEDVNRRWPFRRDTEIRLP